MDLTGKIADLSLDFTTRRPKVTLQINEDAVVDLEKLSKAEKLSISVKEYRRRRSLDANSYYWVLCTKIADAVNRTMNWVHNDMLRKYGQIELIDGQAVYLVLPDTESAWEKAYEAEAYHVKPTAQVKEGKDGGMYRTYLMLKGSHEYDTKEMSVLINGIVTEAKELGIETITPEQEARMMAAYEKHHAG